VEVSCWSSIDLYRRRRRHCPLYAIDAEIPNLDVAGSTPSPAPFPFNHLQPTTPLPGADFGSPAALNRVKRSMADISY